MLGKLLRNDLKKNMRWLWILFVVTIVFAGLGRGCKELGENIMFFKILGIFFDTVFYSLLANSIIQPFLRGFLNFTKSFYGDESYLTHTLPVTKNQLINSKFLTVLIEMLLGFACLIISILIRFASPQMLNIVKLLIASISFGKISVGVTITLFIALVIVEFLMFISIIYFSIVIAYRKKEKRVLNTFLYTALISFISLTTLSIIMLIVLLLNDVKLSSTTLILSTSAFMSVIISGIVVYSLITALFYFLTKKEFNKGVNVD